MEAYSTLNNKVWVTGVPFSNLNRQELVTLLHGYVQSTEKCQVCFVPTNSIMAARQKPLVKKVYEQSSLVICDGVPIQWASSILGSPLKERITGFDLFPLFIQECAKKGYRVFFMGAAEGVAEQLSLRYSILYPQLNIRGYYCPPMSDSFSKAENEKMVQLINNAETDVLFVSLTAPKQDIWIHQHLDQLNVKIAMGVGAAFNAELGNIKRAPEWMQSAGLEWFYRFIQEPFRLFRRYFIEAPLFIPLVVKQYISQRNQLKQ